MKDTALFDAQFNSQPRTDAEYEAEIDRYIVELDRMMAQMAEDRKIIQARHREIEDVLKAITDNYKA